MMTCDSGSHRIGIKKSKSGQVLRRKRIVLCDITTPIDVVGPMDGYTTIRASNLTLEYRLLLERETIRHAQECAR